MKKLFLLSAGIFTYISSFASGLSGTYTIDSSKAASATNYQNIRSACSDLDSGRRFDGGSPNGKGISGPVTFNIADGIYFGQFSLESVPGSSAVNTITFQSASGDSTKVTFSDTSSFTDQINNYVLLLSNTRYIIFQKMTFQRTGNYSWGTVIRLQNSASYNTVRNCRIVGVFIGPPSTPFSVNCPLIEHVGLNAQHLNYNCYQNNNMKYGLYGFELDNSKDSGTILEGNIIDSTYLGAIFSEFNYDMVIRRNYIDHIIEGSDAVDIWSSIKEMSYNKIFMPKGEYAVNIWDINPVKSKTTAMIFNNFIVLDSCPSKRMGAGASAYAFSASANGDIKIFHNTILLMDSSVNAVTATFDEARTSGSIYFENNIVVNMGKGMAIVPSAFSSDNNIYYTGGTYLGKYINTLCKSLKDFQVATGTDKKSKFYLPQFVARKDLHLKKLTPYIVPLLKEVKNDIDRDLRITSTNQAGADAPNRDSNDIGVIALLSPLNSTCGDSTTHIKLTISNWGNTERDSDFSVHVLIKGSTSYSDSVKFKGILKPGKDTALSIAMYPAFNTWSGGTYTITSYTQFVKDSNHANDTMRKFISFYPRPNPHFSDSEDFNMGIYCVPNDTNGMSYSWNFGNGDSSTNKFPFEHYMHAGTYDVSLKIKNSYGCVSKWDTMQMILITAIQSQASLTPSLRIYPNPAINVLFIENKSSEPLQSIAITDIEGRLVQAIGGSPDKTYSLGLHPPSRNVFAAPANQSRSRGKKIYEIIDFKFRIERNAL